MSDYQAFQVELKGSIAHVQINRPEKVNAMNAAFWTEIIEIFQWIDETDAVRVVVLSGAGKHFSAGIDLMLLASVANEMGKDVGRNARMLRRKILQMQASFNAVDQCCKPVLAAIQGYCIGGAIDLIAACLGPARLVIVRRSLSGESALQRIQVMSDYQAFQVELKGSIAHVQINRPEKVNAMNATFWTEIIEIFQWIDETDAVRVVVLSGAGKHFSAGIDLMLLASVANEMGKDVGRNARMLRRKILQMQASFNAVDQCCKPVLAAIQGYCIGGAIDLIAACDMRYAAEDAQFSIKEIDMGMAADVGTLQRLPRIIGDGMLRELAYTGRMVAAQEARAIGLVNRVYSDQQALLDGVMAIANEIASKSPIAIAGTKRMISYMRDHSVDDGLDYVATWNAAMLQSSDLRLAMTAHMTKQKPEFVD